MLLLVFHAKRPVGKLVRATRIPSERNSDATRFRFQFRGERRVHLHESIFDPGRGENRARGLLSSLREHAESRQDEVPLLQRRMIKQNNEWTYHCISSLCRVPSSFVSRSVT